MTTTNRIISISVAGRYNSLTLQVSRFFKHSSGNRIYKQTITFFLSSITKKTGLKYNNLMLLNHGIESMSINVLKHNPFKLKLNKCLQSRNHYGFLTKHCVLYEAQSLVIIVYVRFLETLLKDLTNDMKFCVILKQFWLTFALTKKKSEIIRGNFFLFF